MHKSPPKPPAELAQQNVTSVTLTVPVTQANKLIERLKNDFSEAQTLINECFVSNSKSSAKSFDTKKNKQELVDIVTQMSVHLSTCSRDLRDLDATLRDYNIINRFHEEITEKIIKNVAEKTEVELSKRLPDPKQTENPKKKIISNKEQVLVIDGIDKEDIKHGKTFSEALKDNLSDKLQGIPVSKATVNKEGKAILIFPTPETCTQAKESLKTEYDVKNSDRKPTIVQPRLKIHNLDPKLTQYNKDELRNKILSKNEGLENVTEDEFLITFIDKKQNFAIAKVSPNIHKKLTNNGRVYIDLWSNKVTDHFNPVQCFQCQNYNHISTSSVCNAKDKSQVLTCLYCSKNHKSSQCPSKKDKTAHKCANCLRCDNLSIKNGAVTHTSTSKTCPMYIKEVERLKLITCYDQQVFIDSKNLRSPI